MGKNKQLQPVWLNSDSLFQFAHKVIQRSKKLSMYSHDNFLMKEKNSKRRHLVGSYFRSWKEGGKKLARRAVSFGPLRCNWLYLKQASSLRTRTFQWFARPSLLLPKSFFTGNLPSIWCSRGRQCTTWFRKVSGHKWRLGASPLSSICSRMKILSVEKGFCVVRQTGQRTAERGDTPCRRQHTWWYIGSRLAHWLRKKSMARSRLSVWDLHNKDEVKWTFDQGNLSRSQSVLDNYSWIYKARVEWNIIS